MNSPHTGIFSRVTHTATPLRGVRVLARHFYRIFIEPKEIDEDRKRREFIFNVIATSLFIVVCLLDISILYADLTALEKGGFGFFPFSLFVLFLGLLILISRKGHHEFASYLFLGFFFLAATWGEYVWGVAIPIALLSYGAIIVMTSVLIGTRAGVIAGVIISGTIITLGYLQTQGFIESDISWRYTPLQFKDTIENSFIFGLIIVVSWLSNREIERSLARARHSEKALTAERDLLEIRVEERTKELKAAELEKVSQLYRFVEFGRIASGVFHDLLTPLSVVSLSVENLDEKNSEKQTQAREHIDRAIAASKRMESFIQTARKQIDSQDRSQLFSARHEVTDVVKLLHHKSIKAHVEIVVLPGDDIILRGNPVKFFQIIANLVSNALDSYLDVPRKYNRTVTISLSQEKNDGRITIQDQGCGIPTDMQKEIFKPFFTTKQNRPRTESGFGLGLSTTKDILEKDFNGTIDLISSPGTGSTFIVNFPLNEKNYLIHTTKSP